MIGQTSDTKAAPSSNSHDWVQRRAQSRMRVTGFILIVSLAAVPCAGMELSRVTSCAGGDVLKLRGDIEAGDYVKFRSYFGDQRRIAGLDLDSPGGSLYEGFRIATLTRQKRLSTFVSKECDSACAFIFLVGSKRYAAKEAKIGVHAVGNDYGGEDSGTIRDTIRFARLSAKFGIPSSTIGKMVTTPPGKITFLDQTDLSALKVIVRDPFKADDGVQKCNFDREKTEASANGGAPIGRVKTSHRPDSRSGRSAGFLRPLAPSRAAARAP
jgi:hypothetical protein